MQLVERGALDLDAADHQVPARFQADQPLRQGHHPAAIACRIVRAWCASRPWAIISIHTEPSLEKTVESLNRTELVYEPETKTKYSNAGIAVVGFVLEETQKQAFARYLSRTLLQPLGMTSSSFEPDPAITKNLAKAADVDLPWPRIPGADVSSSAWHRARCMYSTVLDLARFLSVLFAGGKTATGRHAQARNARSRCASRSSPSPTRRPGFGLGFQVLEFEGRRRIGHGGAVYGFATDLAALPDDKLGVVVIAVARHAAMPSRRTHRRRRSGTACWRSSRKSRCRRLSAPQPLTPAQVFAKLAGVTAWATAPSTWSSTTASGSFSCPGERRITAWSCASSGEVCRWTTALQWGPKSSERQDGEPGHRQGRVSAHARGEAQAGCRPSGRA